MNNTKYKHNELDLLPPNLAVAKAKTRETDSEIFFQGEHSPLSNFFPAKHTDESGVIYYTAEQAFQHKKAKFHGKIQLANKILCERNPYELKKMAKDIPSSNDWLKNEQEVMTKILRNKFQQNPDLASTLINTGQKYLHEATRDRKWSTGAELTSKALLNSEWQGQSLMGQLLQIVRNEFVIDQSSDNNNLNPPPTNGIPDVYDDITPMPDDPPSRTTTTTTTTTTPPPKQPSPAHTSTPVARTSQAQPQAALPEDNTLDPYLNTGARPKALAEKNITSPTPPPRNSRPSRVKKSSLGGIINC